MTVSAHIPHRLGRVHAADTDAPLSQLAWFAGIAAIAFAIPYVLTSVFDINHDLYYLATSPWRLARSRSTSQ